MADPVHDVTSNSGVKHDEAATSAYSHTAGTLINGIALVRVSAQDSTPGTITGVTYGGAGMTLIGQASVNADITSPRLTLWYLVNPVAGASAIVVSFSEAMNSHIVSCSTYSGVHQSIPYILRAGNWNSRVDVKIDAPSAATVTVDTAPGEMVVAVADFFPSTETGSTLETTRVSVLDSGNHFHGGSDLLATGTSTVMSWTSAAGWSNAIIAVALNPALPAPFLKLEIRKAP